MAVAQPILDDGQLEKDGMPPHPRLVRAALDAVRVPAQYPPHTKGARRRAMT
jgi:hypothetical protein